jgi:DNA repair exonuclease SbcCD ATPase subunit
MTKKINFEKIIIENFLSIGKKPVEISFKKGLHVITGVNKDLSDRRNGIGKSTVLDALSFALFGSTLRELKKEFIINNITKKTSKVSNQGAISPYRLTNRQAINPKGKLTRIF